VVTPNVVYTVRPWATAYVALDVCQYCRMGFSIDTTCRTVKLFHRDLANASAKYGTILYFTYYELPMPLTNGWTRLRYISGGRLDSF
jgi:hypothetical protein